MQYDLQPKNTSLLLELVYTYDENLMLAKFENAAQLLNKLILDHPDYQIMLARCYLLNGKYDKGLDLVENVLKNAPEKIDAFLIKGQLLLQKKEFDNARMCYEKAILLQPENEKYWSKILDHISYLQNNTAVKESYESFTGVYSFEDGEMTMTSFILNNHIVFKAKNQAAAINYAISDTHFTTFDGINDLTFVKNDQGKIIKAFYHREEMLNGILWKEDSLICKAFNLLNQNAKADALPAFIEAYAHNPDHYYLENFIRHLEFIQSEEYERIKSAFDTYNGKYGDMIVFKKNDNLYYKNYNGYIYRLLPVSQDKFMMPSFYNRQVQIIRKNNSVEGIKMIYRDGKEEVFLRNN